MIEEVEIGCVFMMEMFPEDGIKPKGNNTSRRKFFVVVGKDDDTITVASVLINSEINVNKFNRIAPYQHEIRRENYDFLTKENSYVDSYSLREFAIERVKSTAEFYGKLNDEDLNYIKEKIKSSPAVPIRLIKKYNL